MAVGTVGKILIVRLQQSTARIDGGEQSVGDSTGLRVATRSLRTFLDARVVTGARLNL
jgi:hypothetical protein